MAELQKELQSITEDFQKLQEGEFLGHSMLLKPLGIED